MDLFFDGVCGMPKARKHFHSFMQDVHRSLFKLQAGAGAAGAGGEGADPLVQVAAQIAEEARLLCFDEFQVTDVADAMILRRLLEALLGRGVALVATSNRLPRDLYLHGLNRPQFLPAIALLEDSCEVHAFDAEAPDYRLMHLSSKTWMHPLGPSSESAFEGRWEKLTAGREVAPARLQVQGREVPVPAACGGACRFTFDALCGAATGAVDYLAVAKNFHTVFLDEVPRMTEEEVSQVRRLITVRPRLPPPRISPPLDHVFLSRPGPALPPPSPGGFFCLTPPPPPPPPPGG